MQRAWFTLKCTNGLIMLAFHCAVVNFHAFYRAILCIRSTSHGPVSVRLSQVGVLLKRLNVRSHKQHRTIAQGL